MKRSAQWGVETARVNDVDSSRPWFLLEKESLSIILNTETVRVLLRARVREWQRRWHRIILSWSENNKKVVGTRSEFRGISTTFCISETSQPHTVLHQTASYPPCFPARIHWPGISRLLNSASSLRTTVDDMMHWRDFKRERITG